MIEAKGEGAMRAKCHKMGDESQALDEDVGDDCPACAFGSRVNMDALGSDQGVVYVEFDEAFGSREGEDKLVVAAGDVRRVIVERSPIGGGVMCCCASVSREDALAEIAGEKPIPWDMGEEMLKDLGRSIVRHGGGDFLTGLFNGFASAEWYRQSVDLGKKAGGAK